MEYLEREEAIFTAPTLLAVSNQAFVVDGWVPTNEKATVEAALKESASHISIEPYEAPHHDHHHDDSHHETKTTPKELITLSEYLEDKNQTVFEFFKAMDLDKSGELRIWGNRGGDEQSKHQRFATIKYGKVPFCYRFKQRRENQFA